MELSRLIRRAVVDRDGHRVGAVTGLCVRLAALVISRRTSVLATLCIGLVAVCVAALGILAIA